MTPEDRQRLRELCEAAGVTRSVQDLGFAARTAVPALLDALEAAEAKLAAVEAAIGGILADYEQAAAIVARSSIGEVTGPTWYDRLHDLREALGTGGAS